MRNPFRQLRHATPLRRTRSIVGEKVRESFTSVLPITLVIFILSVTLTPISASSFLAFLAGAFLLVVGMGLFSVGAEHSMEPLGEKLGATMTKSRRLWVIVVFGFLVGAIVTISEPDLQVLANQVTDIPTPVLIGAVAVGVGLFLVVAMLRILFSIPLPPLLIILYICVFVFAAFVPEGFLAVAFDAGGVTTGPMTVPFILSLGLGVASIRSDKHAGNDSFGLSGLCSIGPVFAVLLLGVLSGSGSSDYELIPSVTAESSRSIAKLFLVSLPTYLWDMTVAVGPILLAFFIFQVTVLRMTRRSVTKIIVGFLYTYVGLVLFLTGVNVGFLPVGHEIGHLLGSLPYNWILLPIAAVIGYVIVSAEPAVHVLNKQVEEITSGAIPQKAMRLSLSLSVSVAVVLSMLRLLFGLPILYILLPGYILALALSLICPKIFTAIAFDSGGIAAGTMTSTFLLPFAIGICNAIPGRNVVTDAFGIVGLVSLTPLITVQILGLVYKQKLKRQTAPQPLEEDIIELEDAASDDIIELED